MFKMLIVLASLITLTACPLPVAAQDIQGPPDDRAALAPAGIPSEEIAFAGSPENLLPPTAEPDWEAVRAAADAASDAESDERALRKAKEKANQRKVIIPLALTMLAHGGDIWTTTDCGKPNNGCVEKNAPGLYGREPTLGRVLAVKLPIMIGTAALTMLVARRSPTAALVFLGISGIATGAAVAGNIRILKYF